MSLFSIETAPVPLELETELIALTQRNSFNTGTNIAMC